MTSRLRLAISAAITFALACSVPTDMCACPPARSAFVLYGRVLQADGTPGAGANLRFDAAFPHRTTECDFTDPVETLDASPWPVADETGSFRLRVYSGSQPGIRCLRVTAFRGAPATTDSVRLSGLLVEFRHDEERLDSLGLRLTLP